MKRNNKKGFTIVELVIVIAVIAILAGVLIPTFAGIVSKANASKALQEAQSAIKVVVAEYAEDGKAMPNATIYYLDKASTEAGAKVTYTIEYTDGMLGEAVKEDTPAAFAYTSGTCYANTAIEVKADDTATTENEAVNATDIADLSKNIIVVVK